MSTPVPAEAPLPPSGGPACNGWPARDADHLLVTSAQMAALEESLFASGLPVEALMEKAALAVSRRLRRRLGQGRRGVLVLVGPGHNGGDGLVVARELHLAGLPVRLWSPFERHKPLTAAHLRHALWLGIPRLSAAPEPDGEELWIDALFGIGQHRPPGEAIETLLLERAARRPGQLIAIDGPTGICADSGRRLGRGAACAAITYCIGLLKQGLVQDAALAWVGRLRRIDLGLPPALLQSLPATQPLGLGGGGAGGRDALTAPRPAPDPAAGKYGRGRLLVVAGSRQYRGAAHLALAGASASGCGSLRAALPQEVSETVWQVHPHVVLQPGLGASERGGLALEDLAENWLERLDAVVLGPGLGSGSGLGAGSGRSTPGPARPARDDLLQRRWQQLQDFPGLVLLDADGLNRLAGTVDGGPLVAAAGWLRGRRGTTWITPHGGEFARLFPTAADRPPLEAAAVAAAESGAVILLKGARSIVAAPDGRRWQVRQACPASARAGLGDVLAGYAGGRGAMAAACEGTAPLPAGDASLLAAAALEHALAGCRAARRAGPGGATPMAVARSLARGPG